jgi:hypothetical protein
VFVDLKWEGRRFAQHDHAVRGDFDFTRWQVRVHLAG